MADDVKVQIGADVSSAEASMKDLEQSTQKSFQKMSSSAEKEGKEVADAFRKSGIRMEKDIKKSSEDARLQYEKIKNSGTASANDIKRAHAAMTRTIKRNNQELGISVSKFATVFKKAKGNIVAAASVIGTAIAAAFTTKAIGEAVGFESAILDLQKVMSDTEGDAKRFTGTVEEMAKKFGVSSTEILQGAANFKQAGFALEDAFKLQEQALKLVIAGDLEAAEAAELLVSTLKGFKAPASDAARLTDVLNEISNKYATNLRELAIGMAEVSPIAKTMGFSFEETAGLLTPIIEVFRSGSESSQAFRTGLLKLLDDAVPVTTALANLGVDQKELNGSMRSGKDIVNDVAQAFIGLDQNSKLVFATQLVGIRQAAKMVEVFDGLAKTTEITNVAMDAAGSINKEVAIRLSSTEVKAKRAAESFKIMSKAIGNILLPIWNKLLDVAIVTFNIMEKGFSTVGRLIDRLPNFTRFINPLVFLAKRSKEAVDQTKKLVEANNEFEESEKKVQAQIEAGKKTFEDRKRLREEEARQVQENAQAEFNALNASLKAQQDKNELIKESITAAKENLRSLEDELNSAVAFTQKVFAEIAKAEKQRAQAEFDPLEKTLDDLERAEEGFRKAADERAAGNIDQARNLTFAAIQAAEAVLSVKKGADQDSEVSRQELSKATFEAEKLVKQATAFTLEMEKAAGDAIPGATAEIESLENALENGKNTLKGLKDSVAEAKTLADELKAKLSENTTATHTQIINTVNTSADSGANSLPGFKTGVKIPGYGGGDKILARLERGERVIRKESVRNLERLGPAAMNALQRGNIKELVESLPLPGYREGGKVESQPSGTTNVNLMLGDKSFPMVSKQVIADRFVKEIKTINTVRGRRRNIY